MQLWTRARTGKLCQGPEQIMSSICHVEARIISELFLFYFVSCSFSYTNFQMSSNIAATSIILWWIIFHFPSLEMVRIECLNNGWMFAHVLFCMQTLWVVAIKLNRKEIALHAIKHLCMYLTSDYHPTVQSWIKQYVFYCAFQAHNSK